MIASTGVQTRISLEEPICTKAVTISPTRPGREARRYLRYEGADSFAAIAFIRLRSNPAETAALASACGCWSLAPDLVLNVGPGAVERGRSVTRMPVIGVVLSIGVQEASINVGNP